MVVVCVGVLLYFTALAYVLGICLGLYVESGGEGGCSIYGGYMSSNGSTKR